MFLPNIVLQHFSLKIWDREEKSEMMTQTCQL